MAGYKVEKCHTCPKFSEHCYEIARWEAKHECKTAHGKGDSLCWCCKHSVPRPDDDFPCPYATELKPVKGWDAKLGKTYDGVKQYHVYDCPLFERGREGYDG